MVAHLDTDAVAPVATAAPDSSQNPPAGFEIDPRSFHVFSTEGLKFLFDRATGSLSELTDFVWSLFASIEQGVPVYQAVAAHAAQAQTTEAEIWSVLEKLRARGFFRFSQVNLADQEFMIRKLWFHKPRRLQLLMAQGCNLGCRYCYAWRNGSNQLSTLMPWSTAKQAIDYLVKRSAHRKDIQITFFGGEPLLNWDVLVQCVEYAKAVGLETGKSFTFEVITNGTLLTKERAHFLADNQFMLMVSIDGWKEMHDYNRPTLGGPSTYDTIVENALYVNNLYKSRGMRPIKVRANMTNRFHDFYKVGNHLKSLGFDRVAVAPIEPLSHGDQSPSSLTEAQMDGLCETSYRTALDIIDRLSAGEPLTDFERQTISGFAEDRTPNALKGIICGIGRNTQCVDNKGNIYPCHRYEGMESFIIGNVFTGHDEEKTMRYYRMVNGNATNRCHSCWIRDYCSGGCAWLLSTKGGAIVDPTLSECDRRRRSFEYGLHVRSRLREAAPKLFENAAVNIDQWDFESADAEADNKCGNGTCGCS
jgi:uncharacterized protein